MEVSNVIARGNSLVVSVAGRINADNAAEFEQAVCARAAALRGHALVLDLQRLVYISSAGLRSIMRLARQAASLALENAQPEVYDVLEMTGFAELFPTTRALRRLSVEGLEVIGRGAKAVVYRLDPETIVKVAYATGEQALAGIMRERELARAAFVAGIPTAISYDVVRVGEGYGAVYELLDAQTLAELVSVGTMSVHEAATALGTLMAQMHDTPARADLMPSARDQQLDELELLAGSLDAGLYGRVCALVAALPEGGNLIHGDLHAGNVMVQAGEALLIDMDTLSRGAAALELGPVYNAYVGFGELDHSVSEQYMGFSYETGVALWEGIVACYATACGLEPERVALVGELMGRVRQLRRVVAHNQQDTRHGRAVARVCTARVALLLDQVDTLEL